jgi:hypothetical protein
MYTTHLYNPAPATGRYALFSGRPALMYKLLLLLKESRSVIKQSISTHFLSTLHQKRSNSWHMLKNQQEEHIRIALPEEHIRRNCCSLSFLRNRVCVQMHHLGLHNQLTTALPHIWKFSSELSQSRNLRSSSLGSK